MRCIPKKTLRKIIKRRHSFVAQVKGNQSELLKWVEFNTSVSKPVDDYVTYDHNTHGRYEERVIEVFDDLYLIEKEWPTVKRIIKVTATVVRYGKITNEIRYYISNLAEPAETLLYIIRSHWKIENSLHYVKDVAFQEDFNRMRTDQIPKVTSLLRSLAINLLNLNNFPNKTKARKLLAWGSIDLFSLKVLFFAEN